MKPLKADAGASKHYLFNGQAPKEGDVVRFPALAKTLKTIAAKGARAFYEGESRRRHGGPWPRRARLSTRRISPITVVIA